MAARCGAGTAGEDAPEAARCGGEGIDGEDAPVAARCGGAGIDGEDAPVAARCGAAGNAGGGAEAVIALADPGAEGATFIAAGPCWPPASTPGA